MADKAKTIPLPNLKSGFITLSIVDDVIVLETSQPTTIKMPHVVTMEL
jgi:hypothetical protein